MTSTLFSVRLKKSRESSLLRRHPWIFSGAIDNISSAPSGGKPAAGETVDVVAADGSFLARGAWSPGSQIAVRVWTFDAAEKIDSEFFRRRLVAAIARRGGAKNPNGAERLVHAESDGLPGVIVDRFGRVAVVQLASAGADRHREAIGKGLLGALEQVAEGPWTVWERSDVEARGKEGLKPRVGLLAGAEPPESVEIEEDGRRFLVDIRGGHKTGFYLDQRANRTLLSELVAARAAGGEPVRVLDAFCYSGGFTVAALAGGATSVVQIDASENALALARQHLELNDLDPESVEQIEGNAFGELRRLRAEERQFDVIVLDPPKFADTKARVASASRGYKDINLLACQLLSPGGLLITFSCSGRLTPELFQKIVADGALDAKREARILHHLNPGADHPVALAFPEGRYLKGLVCLVE